jgi:hypothetical protein
MGPRRQGHCANEKLTLGVGLPAHDLVVKSPARLLKSLESAIPITNGRPQHLDLLAGARESLVPLLDGSTQRRASGLITVSSLHDRTRPITPDRRVRSLSQNFRISTVTSDKRVRSLRAARPVTQPKFQNFDRYERPARPVTPRFAVLAVECINTSPPPLLEVSCSFVQL